VPYKRARMRAHEGGYYVAMDLYDKPGSVAFVAKVFCDAGISIESIVQRAPVDTDIENPTAPFILITHDTMESAMRVVLADISNAEYCANEPRMIRIERY